MSLTQLGVSIDMETKIQDGEDEERLTLQESGTYIRKGSLHMLRFTEEMDEGEAVDTSIIIQDDKITIKRDGAIRMNQIFRIGKETEGVYHHPYGTMRMATTTYRMEFRKGIENRSGRIYIVYEVMLNDEDPRFHWLDLSFTVEEDNE